MSINSGKLKTDTGWKVVRREFQWLLYPAKRKDNTFAYKDRSCLYKLLGKSDTYSFTKCSK